MVCVYPPYAMALRQRREDNFVQYVLPLLLYEPLKWNSDCPAWEASAFHLSQVTDPSIIVSASWLN